MYTNIVILLLVFVSVCLVVAGLPFLLNAGPVLAVRLRKLNQIKKANDALFVINITAEERLVQLQLACLVSFAAGYVFSGSFFGGLIFTVLCWLAPTFWYSYRISQRRAKLDENLPVALDQLASAAKVQQSLTMAFREVSEYAPYPLSEEFAKICRDLDLGIDLGDSIKAARARVNSKLFNLACTVMLVNIDRGGNAIEAMATMSASMKEIWRLEQKLETASAEGRKGALILCIMPLVILCMVLVFQPELAATLISSLYGYIVLVSAIALYFFGILWLRKILNFNI